MTWILVAMCINKLNDTDVFCQPLSHFEKIEQCEKVRDDLNKHEKKTHYYCIPEDPKPCKTN